MGFSSNYESLQAQLTRRFTNGLAFNSAFTWGKAQGYATSPQDGNVLVLERRLAPQLQPA